MRHQKKSERPPESSEGLTGEVFLPWSQSVKTGGGDCFFKSEVSNARLLKNIKYQGNMTPLKEQNKTLVIDPKEM